MHRRRGGTRRRQQVGGPVNLKAFFVTTLSSALDLGIAIPEDVLRHVTPDVLAANLPRPPATGLAGLETPAGRMGRASVRRR